MDHCRFCMRRKNTSNISRVYENTYRKVTKADMKDLLELREEIDEIDRDIVELFEKRMAVSEQVAEYKINTGKKVFDRDRERAKMETLTAMARKITSA